MSQYYNPKRTRNLYETGSKYPFRISRSKVELFQECKRCFYADRKLGVGRPPGFPFSLNSAVDTLLKKEFDMHRTAGTKHPIQERYAIDAIPLDDPRMDEWRDALTGGITYLHRPTNLVLTGGVDDVWVAPDGSLIIVDYKATSKDGDVNLDAEWQNGYKRQMEVYQWLFRKNDFAVSPRGYFVYCNGKTDRKAFDGKLEFDISLLPYDGNDAWVEPALFAIKETLDAPNVPLASPDCDYCRYRIAMREMEVD